MSDVSGSPLVANGQRLPDIAGFDADGNAATLPDMCAGKYTAVLLYRGHW